MCGAACLGSMVPVSAVLILTCTFRLVWMLLRAPPHPVAPPLSKQGEAVHLKRIRAASASCGLQACLAACLPAMRLAVRQDLALEHTAGNCQGRACLPSLAQALAEAPQTPLLPAQADISMDVLDSGSVNAFCGWFDVLFSGSQENPADFQVPLSTAPDPRGSTHWGQQLFALSPAISCGRGASPLVAEAAVEQCAQGWELQHILGSTRLMLEVVHA